MGTPWVFGAIGVASHEIRQIRDIGGTTRSRDGSGRRYRAAGRLLVGEECGATRPRRLVGAVPRLDGMASAN